MLFLSQVTGCRLQVKVDGRLLLILLFALCSLNLSPGQDLLGMVLRIDLCDDLFDGAILIDHKGHPVNAIVGSAHEFFRAPDTVGVDDGSFSVRDEGEREVEFGTEFLVRLERIGAHPDDLVPLAEQLLMIVAQVAGFRRTTGCVVLGVEIKNDLLSLEILKCHPVAVLVCGGEGWSLVTGFQCCHHMILYKIKKQIVKIKDHKYF